MPALGCFCIRFERINGDPIRVRNESSGNQIYNNCFVRTGDNAYFGDWFANQDVSAQSQCFGVNRGVQECPSWHNAFKRNTLTCSYDGRPLRQSMLYHGDTCLPWGCRDNGVRVEAWSNRTVPCDRPGDPCGEGVP